MRVPHVSNLESFDEVRFQKKVFFKMRVNITRGHRPIEGSQNYVACRKRLSDSGMHVSSKALVSLGWFL